MFSNIKIMCIAPPIIARPWSLDARNFPSTIWLSSELQF